MVMMRTGAGGFEQVGHQPRGDRYPRLVLFVGPDIGIIGHNGRDAARARVFGGVDHDEELHEPVIDRDARRLDDENVLAAHAFRYLDLDIFIAELDNFTFAKFHARVHADRLRKREDWRFRRRF
jgi:hypothetical protein